MRTAKFFNKKGDQVHAKFGDLKPIHLTGRRGLTQPVTLPKLCWAMAKLGYFRKDDPRLKA